MANLVAFYLANLVDFYLEYIVAFLLRHSIWHSFFHGFGFYGIVFIWYYLSLALGCCLKREKEKEKGQAKGKEMEKEREKQKEQGCNHLGKTNTCLHLAAVPGTSHSSDDGLVSGEHPPITAEQRLKWPAGVGQSHNQCKHDRCQLLDSLVGTR